MTTDKRAVETNLEVLFLHEHGLSTVSKLLFFL